MRKYIPIAVLVLAGAFLAGSFYMGGSQDHSATPGKLPSEGSVVPTSPAAFQASTQEAVSQVPEEGHSSTGSAEKGLHLSPKLLGKDLPTALSDENRASSLHHQEKYAQGELDSQQR